MFYIILYYLCVQWSRVVLHFLTPNINRTYLTILWLIQLEAAGTTALQRELNIWTEHGRGEGRGRVALIMGTRYKGGNSETLLITWLIVLSYLTGCWLVANCRFVHRSSTFLIQRTVRMNLRLPRIGGLLQTLVILCKRWVPGDEALSVSLVSVLF